MKRYLLLASVAGCLLSAGNAWAEVTPCDGNASGTVNVSATLTSVAVGDWGVRDVDFGSIVLQPSIANDDTIATFANGNLTYEDGKVVSHTGGASGLVALSSMGEEVTGVTFSPTTVDLLDASDNVVAQMTDIAPSEKTTVPDGRSGEGNEPGFFINGKLVVLDTDNAESGQLTGVTTVTLQF